MKLRILAIAAIAVGVLLVPATAWAKGPMAVTITGPGLEAPARLDHRDVAGVGTVWDLAEKTALVDAAYGGAAHVFTQHRPRGRLGSRFRAVFDLSTDGTNVLRQDLYPFASAGFVVHTPSGQRVSALAANAANSGWYVIPAPRGGVIPGSGTAMLIALGATDPRTNRSSDRS